MKFSKFIKNYINLSGINLLNAAYALILYPIVINVIGAESYGVYAYALSITLFINSVQNLGIDINAAGNIAKEKNTNDEINYVLNAKVLSILIVFPLYILFIKYFSNSENENILYLMSISVLTEVICSRWYFYGKQQLHKIFIPQIILKLLSIIFIILYINEENGLILVTSMTIMLKIILSSYSFIVMMYAEKVKLKINHYTIIFEYITSSSHIFLNTLITSFKANGIIIFIGLQYGMAGVASYDIALKIFNAANILMSGVNSSLYPMVMKYWNVDKIIQILKVEFFIGVFFTIVLMLNASFIHNLIIKNEVVNSINLIKIMSPNLTTILFVGGILNLFFIPQKMKKQMLMLQIVPIFTILASILVILVYSLKIEYMAFSWTLAGMIEILMGYYYVKRYTKNSH